MKQIWFLVFIAWTTIALAQIEVKPIAKNSGEQTNHRQRTSAFTTLPFWDDFSTSTNVPGNQWEFSKSVEVTEGLPLNPPTYKAATLDGVDSLGNFYSETETFSGRTDQLISKAIDLSAMTGDESIYLSFFWEAGGNGELPEQEGDSLRLQLLNQDSVWVTAWKKNATEVTDFENFSQEILKIESSYRHEDFRFKFETFGSQQGKFDTWHIDYVYMNTGRTATDLTYFDRAFTGQLQSFVHPYREMPAEHFFNDPSLYLNFQSVTASNLDKDPHPLTLDYELAIENTGEIFSFQYVSEVFLSKEIKTLTFTETPAVPPMAPAPDSIVFTNTISSDFDDDLVPNNNKVNDTLRATFLFQDYYAYDDGNAEFSAGVRNQGSVAIEFIIGEQDTLTHIDVFFPKTSNSSADKTLSLKVWKELDGTDPLGSVKYTIKAEDLNQFIRVQFASPIIVKDTIFIGYKQDTNDFLPIGLDRSNLDAKEKMYYLQDGIWLPNEGANGIMMIRPVFRPLGELVLGNKKVSSLSVYPNPTTGLIQISEEYKEIRVWSMTGQLLQKEDRLPRHDISRLTPGLYVLQVVKSNGSSETFRLIKE